MMRRAAAPRQALMQREQFAARNDPPVRVVGIDHDGDVEAVHVLEPLRFDHAPAGGGEGRREAAVGAPQRAGLAARQDVGERLDERLRAGPGDHAFRRRAVTPRRGGLELCQRFRFGQARPRLGLKSGQGIGVRIDAGREVDPRLGRARARAGGRLRARRRDR